ncbi:hypothetical protein D3C85_1220510 [compost metagenome]
MAAGRGRHPDTDVVALELTGIGCRVSPCRRVNRAGIAGAAGNVLYPPGHIVDRRHGTELERVSATDDRFQIIEGEGGQGRTDMTKYCEIMAKMSTLWTY